MASCQCFETLLLEVFCCGWCSTGIKKSAKGARGTSGRKAIRIVGSEAKPGQSPGAQR